MIFIVLGVPFLLGLFVLSLLLQKQAVSYVFWEKLSLSFAIGLGLLTILMYILGLLKIPLNLTMIVLAVAGMIALISLYLLYIKTFCLTRCEINTIFNFKTLQFSWLEKLLLGMIGLKVVFAFFTALVKPLVDVDAFQFYSIVAKAIYFSGNFFDPYLSQFFSDKPAFPFIAQGWAFIGLGTINDALFKILTPVMFICFILIFYSTLNRYYPRWFCLLFSFFLCSLPFMLYHVTTAYSDFPVTFYYSIGTLYLFLFMKEFRENKTTARNYFLLSFLLLAISLWVKKAALVLTGVNLSVLIVFFYNQRQSLSFNAIKPYLASLLLFLLLVSPLIVQGKLQPIAMLKSLGTPAPAFIAVPSAEKALSFMEKTTTIATTFLRKIFLYGDWQLLGVLLIILVLFFPKSAFSSPLLYLLTILALDLLSVCIQFESGGSFHWLLDGTLIDRLLMNEMPLVLFVCAEMIGRNIISPPNGQKNSACAQGS